MKKLFVCASVLMLSSTVFAADQGNFTDGGPAGSSTPIATTDCTSLNEAVTVKLSKNNVGSYDCTGGVNIGVGVASTAGKPNSSGKGVAYRASSGGGSLSESACANALCATSDTASAAATAVAGS